MRGRIDPELIVIGAKYAVALPSFRLLHFAIVLADSDSEYRTRQVSQAAKTTTFDDLFALKKGKNQ